MKRLRRRYQELVATSLLDATPAKHHPRMKATADLDAWVDANRKQPASTAAYVALQLTRQRRLLSAATPPQLADVMTRLLTERRRRFFGSRSFSKLAASRSVTTDKSPAPATIATMHPGYARDGSLHLLQVRGKTVRHLKLVGMRGTPLQSWTLAPIKGLALPPTPARAKGARPLPGKLTLADAAYVSDSELYALFQLRSRRPKGGQLIGVVQVKLDGGKPATRVVAKIAVEERYFAARLALSPDGTQLYVMHRAMFDKERPYHIVRVHPDGRVEARYEVRHSNGVATGYADGPLASAAMNARDIAVDNAGRLYLTDSSRRAVRVIHTTGAASAARLETVAGSLRGWRDGPVRDAAFSDLQAIDVDPRGAWHDSAHLPAAQRWPAAQALAQVPQWARLVWVSTQVPPQVLRPAGQVTAQVPAEQTSPFLQALAQPPQLAASVLRLTQTPLQAVSRLWQESAHAPALQTSPACRRCCTYRSGPGWPERQRTCRRSWSGSSGRRARTCPRCRPHRPCRRRRTCRSYYGRCRGPRTCPSRG